MTEPVTDKSPRPVPISGRDIMVKALTDSQLIHLNRHARILQDDGIEKSLRIASAERLFRILHTAVIEQEDKDFLEEEEEAGRVELQDLLPFISAFQNEPEKPKARRGRPPKRLTQ